MRMGSYQRIDCKEAQDAFLVRSGRLAAVPLPESCIYATCRTIRQGEDIVCTVSLDDAWNLQCKGRSKGAKLHGMCINWVQIIDTINSLSLKQLHPCMRHGNREPATPVAAVAVDESASEQVWLDFNRQSPLRKACMQCSAPRQSGSGAAHAPL